MPFEKSVNSSKFVRFESQNSNNGMFFETRRDNKDYPQSLEDEWLEKQLNSRLGQHILQQVESYLQRKIMTNKRSGIGASIIQHTSLQTKLDTKTKDSQNDNEPKELNHEPQLSEQTKETNSFKGSYQTILLPKVSFFFF
jgi:hypothetical protein